MTVTMSHKSVVVINYTEKYSGFFVKPIISSDDDIYLYDEADFEDVLVDILINFKPIRPVKPVENPYEALVERNPASGYYLCLYEDAKGNQNSPAYQGDNIYQELVEIRSAPTDDDKLLTVLHNGMQFNYTSYRNGQSPIYYGPFNNKIFDGLKNRDEST